MMTAYEKADLFRTLVDSATSSMMGYVSVLFAFLVAAYLMAPHFNRVMSGIVIGLFSLFSAIMILAVNRGLSASASLANEIRNNAAENSELAWHPVVTEPTNFVELIAPVLTTLLVASAIAGIVFFAYARKRTLVRDVLPPG
jgi:uncharacterized membrane protein